MSKQCSDCGEVDPPAGFNKGQPRCRICHRARSRAWHWANRERSNAASAAYQAADPDRVRRVARDYYARNGTKVRASVKAYSLANPAKVAVGKAKWAAQNAALTARRHAARYYADVEQTRADNRARYAANPEIYKAHARKRKARLRGASVRETVYLKALYERDGGRCRICEKPCAYDVASVDHIIPIAHGGDHSYQNTQLAHLFCNMSRGAGRRPAQARLMG